MSAEADIERDLRIRLEGGRVIGVAVAERIEAAQRMMRRGEVVCWWGEGPDRGVLLVRRSAVRSPQGGGSAA